MAETVEPKLKTWQEKLQAGEPLNPLEETKADADFNYKERLREQEARKKFEELKAAGRPAEPDQTNKKGK